MARRHLSPDPETGKTIAVIEDGSLSTHHCRIECAHSELAFARTIQQIENGRGPLQIDVRPIKGHPRHTLSFVVSPADFDGVVALVEDDAVTPYTDLEFAREIMRATRGNN